LPFVLLIGTAFVIALSGAVMPGPVLFATVRWSAERGRWVGPLIVVGHAAVEVPLLLAIILGLGDVMKRPAFLGAVGLAGGAALLVMGALMLRVAPALRLPQKAQNGGQDAPPGTARIIAAGALTSVSNPYFVFWWATVGLRLLGQAEPLGSLGYAAFYAGHVSADLLWYGAVSESVHRGRKLLSDHAYRWLVGACAAILLGFGVFFACQGFALVREALAA